MGWQAGRSALDRGRAGGGGGTRGEERTARRGTPGAGGGLARGTPGGGGTFYPFYTVRTSEIPRTDRRDRHFRV